MTATLLIEIGVEELPPHAMRPLADAFAEHIADGCREAGLTFSGQARYATPRRLAVALTDAAERTEPVAVEKSGPTVAIAFDDAGHPTPAAEGFARSLGTTVDALDREDSDKGERLVYRGVEDGKPLSSLIQPIVDKALKRLPIPKLMRWGEGDAAFVRPVHWVVALHGASVIELDVFGIQAGRTTRGHRFHHPEAIELPDAEQYAAQLEHPGHVIADPDRRRAAVAAEVERAAAEFGGAALMDDSLLEEVTALVEWPVGIAGRFDPRFLELPREVLISTLQSHQRYFPIEDTANDLLAGFVTVANLVSRDVAQVIAGNERVVRPRLEDALFFWRQDRQRGLEAHVDGLARVSFQKELGSLADKSRRMAAIAGQLAEPAGADPGIVERATLLAKTDLLTEMVGEFPDLQGVMGHYYAQADGEPDAVARALAGQYAPARAGAPIADEPAGRCLALADRLDTLAGIFAINRRPSGDKDPFGLRRAALGALRTLIEGPIVADLHALLNAAVEQQPVAAAPDTVEALWMFHMERLRGYYVDSGIAVDRFEAVQALEIHDMVDFDRRIHAVDRFAALPEANLVAGAHKRIRNILRRNADALAESAFDTARLVEPAETTLSSALIDHREAIDQASAAGDYGQALNSLAALADPLDRFFADVMVMDEDPALRANRLALLAELDALCRRVADISRIALD
ncbi:glycine--tRNA ligase subunit beta [Salinisphaera sp. T31B1]|uniref:glycine--tRNA ligase subunit beta n=1 Tax=Salinisphaera sp. T31B1 TaxID=727963 RepID=UPI00333F5DC6